jgi:hypothetical protein
MSGLILTEGAAPSTPTTGKVEIYAKTDGKVYAKDDAGTETAFAGLTQASAQASTSGTSIDFTGIPSNVKRITIAFNGVSLSGTASFLIQIGDSGGFENTGYSGAGSREGTTSVAGAFFTAGFGFNNTTAATVFGGTITLLNVSGNIWACSGMIGGNATEVVCKTAGAKTLSDTLTQVRITTSNGTDTFDAGSINILYE